MKVVACQFDIAWENPTANFEIVRLMLASRHVEPGSAIVLPELFSTGFSMDTDRIAEPEAGPTCKFLSGLARQYASLVVAGVAIREADGAIRNQAVVAGSDGAIVGRYRKQQPFTLGGEAACYRAGTGALTFSYGGFDSPSPFVCYDLRFPEIFRSAVVRGVQVFFVIANWPIARIAHWVTLLQARAIENQAYVVGVNRTGTDPTLTYNGRSLIVAPSGDILADGGESVGRVEAEISPGVVAEIRGRLPFLADIRGDYVTIAKSAK